MLVYITDSLNSPAINAGDPDTLNEMGFDGYIPQQVDIGAFETELFVEPPSTFFQEVAGQVVIEAEHFTTQLRDTERAWLAEAKLADYTGLGYMSALPDTDLQFSSSSSEINYTSNFATTGTYIVWLRGYAPNGAGDSIFVSLDEEPVATLTGFAPRTWSWASINSNGGFVTVEIDQPGLHTLRLRQREDGLRIDRLLLTTNTTFIPTGEGPAETAQQTGTSTETTTITRTIVYTYDNLYRLTDADYSTGELYEYEYDAVGNRLKQIIDGDTTEYLYDAANRLEKLDGQAVYNFDDNGNLLNSDTLTNTFDAANRLTSSVRNGGVTVESIYNGVNDRVAEVTAGVTTTFALDVLGLPEVIYTSDGNAYLHLPGVIVAESSTGETRYLLSDGLGSIRHATDENAQVVVYNEFDPYGNPVEIGSEPYGYTGEWWGSYIELLQG